ncbi:MAG: patatin-like phospholipase family protein [Pyrinomonadaceae bacterium]|nr:patatin-like phospholipase family protein [Pyrinomonadaceae bacterium]
MARYRIMTFDGGGVRGALMAILVKRLVDRFPNLLDQVDLFAGTSTGSVVALTLASGLTADTLVNFYSIENLRSVFSPARFRLFRPKYGNANFKSLLESHFPGSPRLGDLKKHKLLATSFKLDERWQHDWSPVFSHNFPGSHHLEDLVVDVALRSAAAPTFFPSHQGHVDGGMMANNPSTAAIALAMGHHQPRPALEDICLLSVGTGLTPTMISLNTQGWGVVQWMLNPFRSPAAPLLNILFEGVVEADTMMSGYLLRSRYCRLNPPLPRQTALDDWKAIEELIQTANDYDLQPTFDWIASHWI